MARDQKIIQQAFAEYRAPVIGASACHERGIWQRRFWEHALHDDADYAAHVDCVHINPYKHAYVERVADWPYSTFHRYICVVLYPMDWACSGEPEIKTGERK